MSLKRVDALSADILDEDFIKIYQPMHFIQRILGFQRVKVDYRFVTATPTLYKFYSAAVWAINGLCLVISLTQCHNTNKFKSVIIDKQLQNAILVNAFFNTIIAWKNNFYDGNSNSQLYVKLQRIDRALKMKSFKRENYKLAILSLILTSFATISGASWALLHNLVLSDRVCVSSCVIMFLASPNCIEMILVFHMFVFIIIRIVYVNSVLQKQLVIYTSATIADKPSWTVNKVLTNTDCGFQELVCGVHSIMDALIDIVVLFRFSIFALVSQLTLSIIALVQGVVDSTKNKMSVHPYMWAVTLPILSALALIIVILAGTAGYLTSKLETTRKLSLHLKSSLHEGKSRDNAKQLMTLLTAERCVVSVYDIFVLDRRLPLQLFTITATYTIVLLQFATLK